MKDLLTSISLHLHVGSIGRRAQESNANNCYYSSQNKLINLRREFLVISANILENNFRVNSDLT